jgi:hypothetical protein
MTMLSRLWDRHRGGALPLIKVGEREVLAAAPRAITKVAGYRGGGRL